MPDLRIRIDAHEYPIHIESGCLDTLGAFIARRTYAWATGGPTRAFVVSDETVATLYGRRVLDALTAANISADILRIPPGEGSKTLGTAAGLYTGLLERGIDRKSVIVALGGGVVGDLAGFVAATVLRGVDYVQAPTTILAQVDSSIGGKTAVDHPLGKNLIGAFHHPVGVLTDPQTLGTLPRREFAAGLAEVVKAALIRDAEFLAWLEQHAAEVLALEPAALTHAIVRSCEIKAAVVEADPRDMTGLRAILNYGHTIGHALEAVTRFGTYLHGEAVAVGMMAAARIAAGRGLVDAAYVERQQRLLAACGLPVAAKELADPGLVQALFRDKKVEAGRLRFILPTAPGAVAVFADVTETEIRRAVAATA